MARPAKNQSAIEADNIVKLLQDASKNAQDKATIIRQGRTLVSRMESLVGGFKNLLDEMEGSKPVPPQALGETEEATAPRKHARKKKAAEAVAAEVE